MIIWGFRTMTKVLAMLTFVCHNCGNPAAQRLVKYSRWFTLFFIPLFPFSVKRVTTCTFCGVSTKVTKEQADQLVAGAQSGGPVLPAGHPDAQQQYPGQPYQQGYPQQQYPGQPYQQGYPQQQYPPQ